MFRRSNTEHGQEHPALVGVVRVGGDDPSGLAGGVVGERFDVADITMVRFGRHYLTVCDVTRCADSAATPAASRLQTGRNV